jgi:SRSO17 transposase
VVRADTDRSAAAGIPADTAFTTKPMLARQAILDALAAGIEARWVAGDEVYGADPKPRNALQDKQIGYVLAVACDHRIPRLRHPDPRGRPRRHGRSPILADPLRRRRSERTSLLRLGVDLYRRACRASVVADPPEHQHR